MPAAALLALSLLALDVATPTTNPAPTPPAAAPTPPSAPAAAPAPPPAPQAPAAAAPAQKAQVLLLDLESVESEVARDKVSVLQGRIAATLAERNDLDLVTAGDLKAMTALEADKSLVGCDQSSCLAELAAALGARYVVFGRVSKLDENYLVLQLNLFDSTSARAVGRTETDGASLKDLVEKTPAAVQQLFGRFGDGGVALATTTSGPSALAWTGALTAGVGAAAGLGLGVGAYLAEQRLVAVDTPLDDRTSALEQGPLFFWGAVAGGAVAVVGAGVWALAALTAEPTP
jgi:hypothetical protein